MVKNWMEIVALDPGRTTGYAMAIVKDGKPYIGYAQAKWDHQQLFKFLDSLGECNIICESFEFRQRATGVDYYPVELIGVIQLIAQIELLYLAFQPASVQGKKAHFSDARLKQMELYQKGEDFHHGRSAVKHLLYWMHFGHGSMNKIDLTQAELVTISWLKDEWLG